MGRNVKTFGAALSQTSRPVTPPPTQEAMDAGLSDFVYGMQQMALQNQKVGIGTPRDQRAYSDYVPTAPIHRVVIEALFRGSWLGNRIISCLPEDMVRAWRKVKWDGLDDNDTDVKMVQRLEKKLRVKQKLLSASKWARAYGGCILIPVLRSQPDEVLAEPLDYDQIEKDDLVGFQVVDRWRCNNDGTIIRDPLDPELGMPERYRLAESSVSLHHTRVIRLEGREMPYFIWRANALWHDSVLQILINNLKQYDSAVAALTTMMFQMNVDIIMQSGLRAALSTKNGKANALERFRQFVLNKSFNGVGVLDKDTEEYQRHPYTFSGVDKAFDKVMHDVCGAADVPFTRLFGQSPAGMNATGESDDRHYYDHVAARREEHLDPALNKLDEFLIRSALGYMPEGYESEWLPLWQPTDTEKAQTENTKAQTAQIHWNMGCVDEGIVAGDLYARGVYAGMTKQHVKAAQRVARQSAAAQEQGFAAAAQGGITNLPPGGPGKLGKKALQNQVVTPEKLEDEEDENKGG
jgi:uncharacterized protein